MKSPLVLLAGIFVTVFVVALIIGFAIQTVITIQYGRGQMYIPRHRRG